MPRLVLALALLTGCLTLLGQPNPCHGVICPPWPCFTTSGCGYDCICLRVGNQRKGVCISVEVD